jgi:AP-1 complex subunit gamma-1
MDTNAVLRHRQTILACLHDGDISIRRRALELCYALVNGQNVRLVVKELLAFLEVADNEFKLGLTTELSLAAERFAPDKRWHIDTVLRTLKLAGNFVREEILASFIRLVCHTPELQAYTVRKLYLGLGADLSQESLTLAATWLIGEFGDVLLDGPVDEGGRAVSEGEIVDLLLSVLHSPYSNSLSSQFVLTALVKLSARFAERPGGGSHELARIEVVLRTFDHTQELELQQRAVEYGSLLGLTEVRTGVLERMPPPEIRQTIMGTVSEKRSVGSTRSTKDTVRLGGLSWCSVPAPSFGARAQAS